MKNYSLLFIFICFLIGLLLACNKQPSDMQMTEQIYCQQRLKLIYGEFIQRVLANDEYNLSEIKQAIIEDRGHDFLKCPVYKQSYYINPSIKLWKVDYVSKKELAVICSHAHRQESDGTVFLGIDFEGLLITTNCIPSWTNK